MLTGFSGYSGPLSGMGAVNGLGGCGCSSIPKSGVGSPDGLGAWAGFDSVTGSNSLDGGAGALIGYVLAPKGDNLKYAAIGGLAGVMMGGAGLLGTLALALYLRNK